MDHPPATARAPGPRPLPSPPRQPVASGRPADVAGYSLEPSSARLNAHEALFGGRAQAPEHQLQQDWPFQQRGAPSSRGSTFFVSGSGTQRLGAAPSRPPLAFEDAPSSGGREQQQPPTFDQQTSYSPPRSPQQLPAGARPLPTPPARQAPNPSAAPNRAPPPQPTTKVPLATSSSILLHSGFWQILSASGSRFLTSAPSPAVVAPTFPPGFGDDFGPSSPQRAAQQDRRLTTAPVPGVRQQELKKKKRVSTDQISSPQGFQHLVHASDHEQAAELLHRWHQDGVGKLGRLSWAAPIKQAARARVRARGIAEVQAHRAEAEPSTPVLQITNGLSIITSSTTTAVEDEKMGKTVAEVPQSHGKENKAPPQLPDPSFPSMARTNTAETTLERTFPTSSTPGRLNKMGAVGRGSLAFAEGGTTRYSPQAWDRPALPGSPLTLSFDRPGVLKQRSPPSSPSSDTTINGATVGHSNDETSDSEFGLPRNFVPSLTTIEKAASTRIYFETKYHGILKKPRDRDQRKAMLEAELARLQMTDRQRNTVRAAWALSETEYLREMRRRVDVGSFRLLKIVGRGAFGVVSLVQERGTGQLYAMKRLAKKDMLRKQQEGHVRAERDLLASAASTTRWTVKLAYSFQDVDHLYLVMDFMAGGDLLTLLIERDTFPESMARFYISEMLLGISETHRVLGAIHRDIKPDNFLFDAKGHIAISDFGLATDFHWSHDGAYYDEQRRNLLYKHGIDLEGLAGRVPATAPFDEERLMKDALQGEDKPGSLLTWRDKNRRKLAYSVVGTNNYFAKEVLTGYGYDQACDWWSLGVIMYEMLYGYPPFVSKNRNITRQKILTWKTSLRFPAKPRISREAQDLICSLFCEPEDRIGSRGKSAAISRPNSIVLNQRRSGFLAGHSPGGQKSGVSADGVEEIMAHPWFKSIDFANIHLQTPPFVPDLASTDDTRYFEDDIQDTPLPGPEIAPGVPAPDTTKDVMLRDPEQGAALLEVRKGLAFQGWTFKKPRRQVYDPRRGLDLSAANETVFPADGYRGESVLKGEGSSLKRSLSV